MNDEQLKRLVAWHYCMDYLDTQAMTDKTPSREQCIELLEDASGYRQVEASSGACGDGITDMVSAQMAAEDESAPTAERGGDTK